MRRWTPAAVALALPLLAAPALAASDAPGPAPATASPADRALILSIRARALGVILEAPSGSEVERMTAPTGEGTSRMPSATTEIARGVYLTVRPACIPGVDEPPFLPPHPFRRR
jgi:hypothetical protein